MLVHSASRFLQQISKKQTWLHPNYVYFDAYKAKYVNTAILAFHLSVNGQKSVGARVTLFHQL